MLYSDKVAMSLLVEVVGFVVTVLCTWGVILTFGMLLSAAVYATTGFTFFAPLLYIHDIVEKRWGANWAFGVIGVVTFIPAFLITLVFH